MADPAVVLVCGMASDEEVWAAQAGPLDAMVVVPEGDSIEGMAKELLAVTPPTFAVVGLSMGGYIALAAQRQAPTRIRAMALVNSSAAPDTTKQRQRRLHLIELAETEGIEAVADRLAPSLVGPDAPAALRHQLVAMVRRAGAARFARDQLATMARPDARDGLRRVAVPVLAVTGDADRIVPPDETARIADLAPHGRLHTFGGCGHSTPLERPTELLELLESWLATLG